MKRSPKDKVPGSDFFLKSIIDGIMAQHVGADHTGRIPKFAAHHINIETPTLIAGIAVVYSRRHAENLN